uniref:Fibronectin n=1 Tax=Petromyzon marinus TaxID=7757 RepID=S4RMW2_PETMA
ARRGRGAAPLHLRGERAGPVDVRAQRSWRRPGPDPDHPGKSQGPQAARRTRCRLGRGVEFVSGQRWTRAQGQHREICSCSAGGEANADAGMARTRGGNADGDPCVFPFVFEGMALWGCTARGRTDGRQWCGTTSNFDRDSRYTYCVDEHAEMLVPSQGGNSHGALCALPFSFGGRVYSECTAVGRDDGELWCSTTADFDGDGKYGFCPMNGESARGSTRECLLLAIGTRFDSQGGFRRCTACVPPPGQCSVDGVLHESGKSFFKRHEEGHLMNCTCHGRERGMWTCDGLDQCQDSDSRDYHQVGDTWAKVVDGLEFRCHCYGNGIGEWNCKRTTPPEASVQPVQVMISESPTNRHSHPVRWINPSSSAASGYNLKWRAKDSEARWREVDLGVKEDGYVVTGLDPGITYEGQLFTLRPDGHRDVTRFQFSTSATPRAYPGGSSPPWPWCGHNTNCRHDDDFLYLSIPVQGITRDGRMSHDSLLKEKADLLPPPVPCNINALPGQECHGTFAVVYVSMYPAPEPPEGLKVVDMTESSITIGWDRTDEQLTAYRVVLLPDTGRAPKEMMLHPGATSVMLLELVSAEAYTVRLYAVSGDAQSRPSSLQASTHGDSRSQRRTRLPFVSVAFTMNTLFQQGKSPVRLKVTFPLRYGPQNGYSIDFVTLNIYVKQSAAGPVVVMFFSGSTIPRNTSSRLENKHGNRRLTAPRELRVTDVEETALRAEWLPPPGGPISGYRVRCLPAAGGEEDEGAAAGHQEEEELPAGTSSHRLEGLQPGQHYVITVTAVRGQEHGPPASLSVDTLEPFVTPDFKVDVTETTITISWASVPGLVVRVLLVLSEGGADPRELSADSGELLLPDLTPSTEYTLTIIILLHGVQRGPPIVKLVTTSVPPPRGIEVEPRGDTGELRISWIAPEMPEVGGKRSASWNKQHTYGGILLKLCTATPSSLCMNRQLRPGTEYEVAVHTIVGEHESVALMGTQRTAPDPPRELQIVAVSDSSLNLQWLPPAEAAVSGYRVRCATEEDPSVMFAASNGREDPRYVSSDSGLMLLPDLSPHAEYTLTIIILLHGTQRGPPIVKHVTTAELADPSDLRFSHVGAESMHVSWAPAPPPASPTHYVVHYSPLYSSAEPREVVVAGDATSVDLGGLHPGLEYRVKVHAADGDKLSAGASGTHKTAIDSPTQLEFLDVTDSSLTVAWQPPRAAITGYRVRYGPEGGAPGYANERLVTGDRTQLELHDLEPGTDYVVRVISVDGREESLPLMGQTRTEGRPRRLEVAGESPSSLTLTWYQPSAPVDHYTVTCTPLSGREEVRELLVPGSSSRATLQGLATAQEYNVSIRATYGQQQQGGPMLSSQPVYIVHYLGVDQPSDMQILDLTESSIRVRWNPCRAPILGYLLTCTPTTHPAGPSTFAIPPGETDVTITKLVPTVEYVISVCARRHNQDSEPTTLTFTTKVDSPRGLEFLQVAETWVLVQWEPPEGRVSSYRITYESSNEGTREFPHTPRGDVEEANITGLTPGLEYTVRVYATYGQDESVPLTGCQVTAIPAPTDLQFHFVTASGLTVSWAAPVGVELTGFRVVLMPRDRKGPTLERSQSPKVTTTTINGLLAQTEYEVSVYALKNYLASKSLQAFQKTQQSVMPPGRLRALSVTGSTVLVAWRSRAVRLSAFLLIATPLSNEGLSAERLLSPLLRACTITGVPPLSLARSHMYTHTFNGAHSHALAHVDVCVGAQFHVHYLTTIYLLLRQPPFTLIEMYSTSRVILKHPQPGIFQTPITRLSPGVTYSISIYAMREGSRSQPTSITVTTSKAPSPQRRSSGNIHSKDFLTAQSSLPMKITLQDPGVREGNGVRRPSSNGATWEGGFEREEFLGAASPTFLRDGRSDHVGAAPGQLHTTVTWRPSGGSTEHHVTCLPIGDSSPVVKLTLPGGAEAATLRGLRPGAVYRVLVEAMGLDGRNTLLDETLSLNNTGTTEGAGEARILDGCLEGTTGTAYAPGEHWEQRAQNGLLLTCTCLGEGRGHVRCDSSKWC